MPGLRARVIGPGDHAVLLAWYADSRAEELAATGWPAPARHAFLTHQFALQHHHYQTHHRGADFLLLLQDERPVGRLYWQANRPAPAACTLIDVCLQPAARGRGLGTALLRGLIGQAEAAGRAIDLHVEAHNPALRWYQRLGFAVHGQHGLHLWMRRLPLNHLEPGDVDPELRTLAQ